MLYAAKSGAGTWMRSFYQEELLPHWSRQLGRDHIFIFSDQGMNFFPDRPRMKNWETFWGDGVPSVAKCIKYIQWKWKKVRLRITMRLQKQRLKLEYTCRWQGWQASATDLLASLVWTWDRMSKKMSRAEVSIRNQLWFLVTPFTPFISLLFSNTNHSFIQDV